MNTRLHLAGTRRWVAAALLAAAIPVRAAVNTWDGTTWSGGTPAADDDVVIEGDLIWEAPLPSTVASWTQNSGTVTVLTTCSDYSETFTLLTVRGDMTINGGKLTHGSNCYDVAAPEGTPMPQRFRLALFVGGNLTVAGGAAIDADGLGMGVYNSATWQEDWNYGPGHGVGEGAGGSAAASHGGFGGGQPPTGPKVYGSVMRPELPGSSASTSNWGASTGGGAKGGGAILATVAGSATVNGAISANGNNGINSGGGGSGGSILIEADSLSGSGTIHACGGGESWHSGGGGGRIALLLGSATEFSGSSTRAGTGGGGGAHGGAGTVYIEDGTGKDAGMIVVDNDAVDGNYTAIPAPTQPGDDVFDAASLLVRNWGKAILRADLRLARAELQGTKAILDLNGRILTVGAFTGRDGAVFKTPGVYTDNSSGAFDGVSFAVAGNAVAMPPTGTILLLR